MNHDWMATFEALKSVYTDGAFSNIAINEAVGRHKSCSAGFVRYFCKGVLRDSIRIDHCIAQLADRGLKGIRPRTMVILRMGIYAIDSMESIPDHAAVSEAVTLAKYTAKGTDRLVNAILRSYIRRREEIDIPDDDLSLKYGFPADITELIHDQYGEDTVNILKGLNTPPHLVLRVNRLKTTRDELAEKLSECGIETTPAPESDNALICGSGDVTGTKEFRNGLFTIQGLSSLISIEHFAPKPGSDVLDMCAAPGGKTAAMAEIMGNSGSITACDVYSHRLELIEATASRLGITNIRTAELDGTTTDQSLIESFDYVLADVPCSGLGVMSTKPEIRFRSDLKEYDSLIGTQQKILENAFRYTRPGGRFMYSTCTINRNENEAVTDAFAKEHSLVRIIEKRLFLPYNNLMGFYYCIFEKNPDNTNREIL